MSSRAVIAAAAVALIAAAVVLFAIVVWQSAGQPDASTCAAIKSITGGVPAGCSGPGTWLAVAAGICAAAGLLLLFLVPRPAKPPADPE